MSYFDDLYPDIAADVEKGLGTRFRTQGDTIVIGRKIGSARWFLEGKFEEGASYCKKCYVSSTEMKFSEVLVVEITRAEGEIEFDATPLKVDAKDWYIIVLLLPKLERSAQIFQEYFEEDVKKRYMRHVIEHEISHVLTEGFISETGELNYFKSELLADAFLILELNSMPDRESQLELKLRDVHSLLSRSEWPTHREYYRLYLSVIAKLLSLSTQETIAIGTERIQAILLKRWSSSIDELYLRLIAELENIG